MQDDAIFEVLARVVEKSNADVQQLMLARRLSRGHKE